MIRLRRAAISLAALVGLIGLVSLIGLSVVSNVSSAQARSLSAGTAPDNAAPAPAVGARCEVPGGALETPYRVTCWTIPAGMKILVLSTPDGADFWINRQELHDLEPGDHIQIAVAAGDEILVTRPLFSWQKHTLVVDGIAYDQ